MARFDSKEMEAAYDRLSDKDKWKVECLSTVFTVASGNVSYIDALTFQNLLPFAMPTGELIEDPAEGARRMARSVQSYRSSLRRLAAAGHLKYDGKCTVVIDVSEPRLREGARLWEEAEAAIQREHESIEAARRQRLAARCGLVLH